MKQFLSHFLRTAFLALVASAFCHTASAQQFSLPTVSGTETVKIANTANPTNYSATASYKVTFYKKPLPTFGYNYTNSLLLKGTIYIVQPVGTTNGGNIGVLSTLTFTNTTGRAVTAENAAMKVSVAENSKSATLTITSKRSDFCITSGYPVRYFNFLGKNTFLSDLTADANSGLVVYAIQPGGNFVIISAPLDGSSKISRLRGNKAVIRSKIVGARF